MGFDGLMFRRISNLLQEKYRYSKINKIIELTSNSYLFLLYSPDYSSNLLISLNTNSSFITPFMGKYKAMDKQSHFTNLLKTHLEGSTIMSFEQLNNDRIMKIIINKRNDIGDNVEKRLYIELTGKMTNIILTKDDNKIIDAKKRMGPTDFTNRTLMSGALYRLPPIENKQDPLNANIDFSKTISSQLYGISPLLEKEFLANNYDNADIIAFCVSALKSNKIYIGKYNSKLEYHLKPLSLFESAYEEYSIEEGIQHFYQKIVDKNIKEEQKQEIRNVIKKELNKNERKLDKLILDLEKAEDYDKYKYYGELIFMYALEQKDKSMNEIIILDEIKNEKIKIALDPKISIGKNANKFFQKYQKSKKAIDIIKKQISLCKEEIEYYELLKVQVNDADNQSLKQIKEELISNNLIKLSNNSKNNLKRKKEKKEFTIKQYTSKDNILISVGKNNLQNDYLTFSLAKYNDTFFHVKDFPGAHVIVHSDKLNEATIRMAANLAAYFSKARYSSSVPVDYTLVKNIKKPKGYKYGQVIIKNYKTIYIDPLNPDDK
ncbi:MAG: NFACT family protein [Bacilli bacterium]|nr:NFACT family protein [Bacilli bacterium]